MLYFLLIWLYLIIASFCLGLMGLNFLGGEYFKRRGDRVIISLWLGIIFIAVVLLAASLVTSLSFPLSAAIILSLSLFSLFSSRFRNELVNLWELMSSNWLLKVEALTAILALLTIHQVTWGESRWYHYSATRWLSEFGTVPGIPLILSNLGIVSSWFAFIAPLNGDNVGFQAGAVANGFIFCLMLAHLSMCLLRIQGKQARLSDWFFIYFSVLFLIYIVVVDEMQFILVSLSPDFPIILLIGVVGWLILLTGEEAELLTQKSSSWILKPHIVPLILATGAMTIKLSALPLLVIAGLFYGKCAKWNKRRLAVSLLITIAILLPLMLVGIKNSGCLFYPSSTFCFDLPWSPSIEVTSKFAEETHSLENWFNSEAKSPNNPFWLWLQWLKASKLNQLMAVLVLISFICAIGIVRKSSKDRPSEKIWVLALGLFGILFILLKGPLIRFGLGYLLLLPALWLGIYTEQKLPQISLFFKPFLSYVEQIKNNRHLPNFFVGLLGVLLIFSLNLSNFKSFFWLPPPMPTIALMKKQVNNVDYFIPIKTSCVASQLPCAKRPLSNIELRDPSLGIKAGFIRSHASPVRSQK